MFEKFCRIIIITRNIRKGIGYSIGNFNRGCEKMSIFFDDIDLFWKSSTNSSYLFIYRRLSNIIFQLGNIVPLNQFFSFSHFTSVLCTSDGSVVSFQKTAVAVLASLAVFLKTAVAVVMRLC